MALKHRVSGWSVIALVVVALAVGYGVGRYIFPPRTAQQPEDAERQTSHGYAFINPLLDCADGTVDNLANSKLTELKSKFDAALTSQKQRGAIIEGAIYFKELYGGVAIGVNEDREFTPGSLLKVPLAMSIYKQAVDEPGFLDKQIMYDGGSVNAEENYTAPTIKTGSVYSIRDLVIAMLENSDNNAAALLSQTVNKERVLDTYGDFGIRLPSFGSDFEISVRDYVSFFRILYNATYIDRANSEQLLSYLSQSTFRDGLVAGVPSGVVVAHKFGERKIVGDTVAQLHDCGIVYKTGDPYLLCVMMRGTDFSTLAKAIAEVSNIAYSQQLK